jgi:polar amino acid transport system substrate-binding protein
MRKKVLTVTGVTVLAALALAGCAAGGGSDESVAEGCEPRDEISTIDDGTLTVALTNTPPYSIEADGEVSGIDGDIVKAFAEAECLSIDYAPYTYATAIPAIEQQRADIALGGFYRTAARAEVVTLSAPLYLDELSVYAAESVATVDDLLGKTIGTVEGYLWVSDLQALPGTETRVYADSLTLAQDLAAGRIDAALDGYGAATIATQGEDYEINVLESDERVASTNEPSQAAVLLDPANEDLSAAFDSFVEELRADGTLVDILATYDLPASAAEVGDARLIQ